MHDPVLPIFPNLHCSILDHNNLRVLPAGLFHTNTKLVTLRLSDNKIEFLAAEGIFDPREGGSRTRIFGTLPPPPTPGAIGIKAAGPAPPSGAPSSLGCLPRPGCCICEIATAIASPRDP